MLRSFIFQFPVTSQSSYVTMILKHPTRGRSLRLPRNEFVRFLLRFKLEAILLLALSVSTSWFSIPLPLTLILGLAILMIGTYTTFRRQTAQETTKSLRDLKRLVDDLESICFQDKGQGQDFRVVKLLDLVGFSWPNPFDSPPPPKDALSDVEGSAWVGRIQDINTVFQLWLASLKDKVRMLASGNRNPPKYDVYVTIGDFLNLYNNYVEKVAERTVWTASKAYLNDRKVARATFNVFRENLGHLRDRVNGFVKDFNETGPYMVGPEAKALKIELD